MCLPVLGQETVVHIVTWILSLPGAKILFINTAGRLSVVACLGVLHNDTSWASHVC